MSEEQIAGQKRELGDIFGDVPEGHERAWRVEVDGVEIEHVGQVRLWLDIPGIQREARYGMVRSEGGEYPGFFYTEGGGGGTGAVTYALIDGHLYIAVIEQQRVNMWPVAVHCMPGGYRAQNTTVQENADAEMGEEVTKHHRKVVDRSWELGGALGNFNRGLHATLNDGDGINFVAFEVKPEFLVQAGQHYVFQDGIAEVDPGTEKVQGVVFIHWTVAARISDMLMNVGVARLLAELYCTRSTYRVTDRTVELIIHPILGTPWVGLLLPLT